MKLTNFKMEQMLAALSPILKQRNKVGYIAARNTRILRDELTEFFLFKDELIRKYGTPEEGNPDRISILPNSINFSDFMKELNTLGTIEQDVDIMRIKYEEVIGALNGEEILEIEWMLED